MRNALKSIGVSKEWNEMAESINRFIICAVAATLGLSGAPAASQQSPAQIKAQRDRAARDSAARALTEREKAAAAAKASAAAKARQAQAAKARDARLEAEWRDWARRPKVSQTCTGVDCRVVTPEGWAGITAGMNVATAQGASGLDLRDDGHYAELDYDCRSYNVYEGPEEISMLVEEGVITSIEVWGPKFQTDRGIKLGDSEWLVRRVYSITRVEPDIYGDKGDKKLFFDVNKGEFGIKFSINGGRLTGITVGGKSRDYVEHCL